MHENPSPHESTPNAPRPRLLERLWAPGKSRWTTLAITALLVVGGITYVAQRPDPGPETFLEVWITDLPAEFSRLDVRVSGVYVGENEHSLLLVHSNFDLLALRGPGAALKVAEGRLPAGHHDQVRIVFQRAQAELDRKPIDLEIPRQVLTVRHDFGIGSTDRRALLFDINVNESVVIDGPQILFRPSLASVFIHAFGQLRGFPGGPEAPGPGTDAGAAEPANFTRVQPQAPQQQSLEQPSRKTAPREPFREGQTSSPSPTPTRPPSSAGNQTQNGNGSSGNGLPPESERILPSPGDASSVPEDYATTLYGWIVQFVPEAETPEEMAAAAEKHGAEIVSRFQAAPAAYVLATPAEAESLYYDPLVTYLEPEKYAPTLLSTSKAAIRIPDVHAAGGLRDASGNMLDGRGIGIAVIDTGIDGLHPDLAHRLLEGSAAPVQANYKMVSILAGDTIYTDTTSGHGTHVAGIVAGQGKKDAGMKGVAPGAKLIGLGIGELSTTLWTNQALDWVVVNHARTSPPIRIVTNSWGTVGEYDANAYGSRLVNSLVAAGITVVFAAGNGEGTGHGAATTTAECRNPTPGVICVSAVDEANSGTRDATFAWYSSRGLISDRATWPDLSAPGTGIKSARTPFGWVTGVGLLSYYVELQGTSMAAPHVAGAAALMLQANPNLTPAQIESILKNTAYKYDGLGAYDGTGSHYAKGHGLLDVYAAIDQAKRT